MEVDGKAFAGLLWWLRQTGLLTASCFFVYFGIEVLVSAYNQDNPFSFLMFFFSSSFIILISLTLVIIFIYQMIVRNKLPEKK
jgi:hypothetical protein